MSQSLLKRLTDERALSEAESEKLAGLARHSHTPIGMIAFSYAMLTTEDIDAILERQQETGERFGEAAVALNKLTTAQVDRLLEIQEFRRASSILEAAVLCEFIFLSEVMSRLETALCGTRQSVGV
ncbi:MAG: hypothetical protein V3T70_02240 [Phycisphaerae bacterium]